ncbi:hypothetical protein QZH47_17890 [Pseudomonas corrugata]
MLFFPLDIEANAEKHNLAQGILRKASSFNAYANEHEDERQAISMVVAMAQGPKGLVQLIVINAVSETEQGRALFDEAEQLSETVGKGIADKIEGYDLKKENEDDEFLIGGGQFMASV